MTVAAESPATSSRRNRRMGENETIRYTGTTHLALSRSSRDWAEVAEVSAREHSFTVPNLKEGEEAAFRIRAVNAIGPSEPSRPTETIKVEDQPGRVIRFRFAPFERTFRSFRKTLVRGSERNQRHHRSRRKRFRSAYSLQRQSETNGPTVDRRSRISQ